MVESQAALLRAWRTMVRIRAFEERLAEDARAGRIPGRVHLCIGQEAIAAGICLRLTVEDCITSTHRGHGHAIAKGADIGAMMAEILGGEDGLCRGRGGSMHLADPDSGLLGANGIVGANAPLALGAALAAKRLGTTAAAVCFVGDGGANQGAVFESMNMAAAFDLPCLFVIEDNGYGEYTPGARITGTDDLAARAGGFGMPALKVDGTDYFAVESAAHEALAAVRGGAGPFTIVAEAPRLRGHFEGDAQAYRPAGETERLARERDPLAIFRRRVLADRLLDADDLDRTWAEAEIEVRTATESALGGVPADPKALLDDVYADG